MGHLRKIRIGTDIITMLSVNISGNPVTWSDTDIRHVFAFSDVQGQPVAEMAFRSEGQSLRCTYAAKDQNYTGTFRVIVEFADGTSFASTLDVPAFEIVRTTEEADAEVGEVVLDIDGTMRFYSLSEAISKIEDATAAANQAASTANTAATNANEKANLAQQAADNANKAKEETDRTNEDAQKAELKRSRAESERLSAETSRKSAEAARRLSETEREQNEEGRAGAEDARVKAEDARRLKELERQGNETRRQEAERARANKESSRAEAEKERESSEASRKDAETKRVSAESGRVTAEKERVTEFSRLKSESETATDNATKAATKAVNAAAAAAKAASIKVVIDVATGIVSILKGEEKEDIGRIPEARGEYVEGQPYYKDNIVLRYGSAFQCVAESTTTPPATIDESGKVMLGEGWIFFADASGVAELKNAVEALKSGKVTDNRVLAEALVSLEARISALEGGKPYLGNATTGVIDVNEITRARYPLVMVAHGVPAETNVPDNLPAGLPWDGVPAFVGQQYINLDAPSGGLYYATGNEKASDWKQA